MCRSHVRRRCGDGRTGDKLEVNVVFAEGFLHCVGALVVEDVESGGCTMMSLTLDTWTVGPDVVHTMWEQCGMASR